MNDFYTRLPPQASYQVEAPRLVHWVEGKAVCNRGVWPHTLSLTLIMRLAERITMQPGLSCAVGDHNISKCAFFNLGRLVDLCTSCGFNLFDTQKNKQVRKTLPTHTINDTFVYCYSTIENHLSRSEQGRYGLPWTGTRNQLFWFGNPSVPVWWFGCGRQMGWFGYPHM